MLQGQPLCSLSDTMKDSDKYLPFVIERDDVNQRQRASGLSLESFLATLVEPTRSLARPPISKFHVGAVGLGSSGRVFLGVNIEFPGVPLNFSIHAEQFLVANAARNGERKLEFLAVSAAPCGHCRQFLQELRGAEDIRLLIAGKDVQPLSHFLPERFGPQDLLDVDFPLLLEPQHNGLRWDPRRTLELSGSLAMHSVSGSGSSSPLHEELARLSDLGALNVPTEKLSLDSKEGQDLLVASQALGDLPNFVAKHLSNSPAFASSKSQEEGAVQPATRTLSGVQLKQLQQAASEAKQMIQLRVAALEAANSSYAPYSGCHSGIAMLSAKGGIYTGPYFESAAYNPSLPPLQSAVIAFIAEGGGALDEISTVVLVEKEGSAVQQAAVIRLALEKISPSASFFVHPCQTGTD